MEFVSAASVPAPVLPFEEIDCPPLGGKVKVRALLLTQRMGIEQRTADLKVKRPDEPEATNAIIPEVLAICVCDGKDQPVYSRTRWDTFGAQHPALALELFNAAWRLSGLSGEAAKKN